MRWARLVVLVGAGLALSLGACGAFEGKDSPLPVADAGPDAGPDVVVGVDAPVSPDVPDASGCVGVDLMVDPLNCGACGHDCLGGSCAAGACGAYRAVVAARNVGQVAVTRWGIYWIDTPTAGLEVSQCPPAGCPDGGSQVLATLDSKATDITAFGDKLAVGAQLEGFVVVTTPGGATTSLGATKDTRSLTAAGDDGFAFIQTAGGEPLIGYYTVGGGLRTFLLNASPTIQAIAAVGQRLYVHSGSNPEQLSECDLRDPAGCPAPKRLFPPQPRPGVNTRLTATADAVFWIQPDQQRLETCATTGCPASSNLRKVTGLTSVAADDDFVYFTTSSPGIVERCAHDGCGAGPVVLASGLVNPHGLLVTATALYWATDANGSTPAAIWRLAR